jgi:hypothetical protein
MCPVHQKPILELFGPSPGRCGDENGTSLPKLGLTVPALVLLNTPLVGLNISLPAVLWDFWPILGVLTALYSLSSGHCAALRPRREL